jgi:hypothetical protein
MNRVASELAVSTEKLEAANKKNSEVSWIFKTILKWIFTVEYLRV